MGKSSRLNVSKSSGVEDVRGLLGIGVEFSSGETDGKEEGIEGVAHPDRRSKKESGNTISFFIISQPFYIP